MAYLVLDTDVASHLQRGSLPAPLHEHLRDTTACVTFVTVGEFFKGAVKRGWGERRVQQLEAWLRNERGVGSAVAAGIGPIAQGNDIGGSVRIPAYCNGMVRLRVGLGRIPSFNLSAMVARGISGQLMATQGPLTRTVRDAWLALAVADTVHHDIRVRKGYRASAVERIAPTWGQ